MGGPGASVALLSPALTPGSVLVDKYRIESVLGEGGMGVVLAARHLELGHRVAVKVLLPSVVLKSDALERFLREGRAAARLSSPHAARVYDVGRLPEGVPFLVMEFVTGRDLKTILDEDGPQPYARVARWCREAADALVEAHAAGVIHRDIKPANLMLAESAAGRPLVKVLDFGISKLVEDDAPALTQSSVVMGTPQYMAPEQLVSSKHVSPRTDIWAIGVALFELSTGRPPFEGRTIAELVTKIQSAMPPPPSLLVDGIPSSFDAVVLRCLAKDPGARFESMAALSAALEALEAAAGPEAPIRRSVQPPGRARLAAAHVADETVSAARFSPLAPARALPKRTTARTILWWSGAVVGSLVMFGSVAYAVRGQRDSDVRGAGASTSAEPPAVATTSELPGPSTHDALPPPASSEPQAPLAVETASASPVRPSAGTAARTARPSSTGKKPQRTPAGGLTAQPAKPSID